MSENTHNKEQAILEAAEREFLTKGFDGARTTSIASAAGVTHAMLHYYFRSKENIFERILDEKIRLMGGSIVTALGQPGLALEARIREGVSLHFDFLVANPDLPRFIVNEIASKPERYESMRQLIQPILAALQSGLQAELNASAERGDTEPIDVRHLMLDILSLNMFSFIAYPVIEPFMGDLANDREAFFEARKQENTETILRRIRKF